jgi:hypothetical protein
MKCLPWLRGLKFENGMEQLTMEGYAERARKLRAFRGMDCLTALPLVCEIGNYKVNLSLINGTLIKGHLTIF